jgi:putative phosphoesterase
MLIGVISDNHRLIDPALPDVLRGVAEIWHAGDLVSPEILAAMERIAPVVAVRGNNDVAPGVRALPEERTIVRDGIRVLIRHIVGLPPRVERTARDAIVQAAPHIVVMGHSHRPASEMHDGVLYLNPGSCGPRRFSLPRTAARLQLDAGDASVTVVDLDSGQELERRFRLAG